MTVWYENIRDLRKMRGWNQSELARRVGYSDKSMISKIEKGIVDLPRSQIFKFAKALNVTASEIMGETEQTEHADKAPGIHMETRYVKRPGKLFPRPETVLVIDGQFGEDDRVIQFPDVELNVIQNDDPELLKIYEILNKEGRRKLLERAEELKGLGYVKEGVRNDD